MPAAVDSRVQHVMESNAAFGFLSKSFAEAQRSAELDLQLISSRAKTMTEFVHNLGDWPNLKIPVSKGEDVTPLEFFEKIKESGHALAKKHNLDELDFFRNLRAQSNERESFRKRRPIKAQSPIFESNNPWAYFQLPDVEASVNLEAFKSSNSFPKVVESWEPLKKVSEGIKEFEASVTEKSKAQGEALKSFIDKIPKFPPGMFPMRNKGKDVLPLDMPELLESLVRQSEPFLGHIGVKKDVYLKIYNAIQRRGRTASDPSLNSSAGEDSPTIAEELKVDAERKAALEARIASVLKSTGYKHTASTPGEKFHPDKDGRRNIAIFTTASLPWMTGTAVNPLLRAAYLAKAGKQDVTLLVPWLSKGDQEKVYPNQITFDSPAEQEQYVKNWLKARIGFLPDFKIKFYPGLFSVEKRSILAVGDISTFIPDKEADVAVLEEPEHLTWYYHGRRWTEKFRNVIGIVHTNYLEYVKREKNGLVQAYFLEHVNNWMVRCYCHKVVRLSAATQDLPRSMICNVHGVGVKFLDIGKRMAEARKETGVSPFSKGAYYLGKMVWSKGYRELVDLLDLHKDKLSSLKVDVFGSGEDSAAVQSEAESKGLKMKFHKGRDHADLSLQDYKVFINPSMSDVVCTTTAEALAMGKIVVCAEHPSNEFFIGFPNCLTYRSKDEFVERVKEAMDMEPVPLTEEHRHLLSWEAATDRFLECADLDKDSSMDFRNPPLMEIKSPADLRNGKSLLRTLSLSMSVPDIEDVVDRSLFMAHFFLSGVEGARVVSGAPPKSKDFGPEVCKELGMDPPEEDPPIVYGW